MSAFRAIVIEQEREGRHITAHTAETRTLREDFLAEEPVEIDVGYSGLNYKDALAVAGRPGIVAASPLIPGIDLAGTVTSSADPRFRAGDRVVLNGAGLGERLNGGLAERAHVDPDALVALPENVTTRSAAAIGTAGFTAMLSVLALEHGGLAPADTTGERGLPVLVTGATGGVGSIAIAVLARLGYRVAAATGRPDEHGDYLRGLGAAEIVERAELEDPGRPLQSQRWAGAVDAVGGTILANVLAQTRYGGTVTACGLAQGPELATTVMPFILRAVTLAGINSVDAPLALREEAWRRLASDLDPTLLEAMTTEVALTDAVGLAEPLLAGELHGRTVVDVRA